MEHHAFVLSVGARSATGLNALQIAMAARAKQFEPVPTPFRDKSGERYGFGRSRALDEALRGTERLVALARPAYSEVIAERKDKAPLPIILCVPESFDDTTGLALCRAIAAGTHGECDPARSSIVQRGHAGFAVALGRAIDLMLEGAREVIVGGVESRFDEASLATLEARGALVLVGKDGGLIPSEAAAFVRLTLRKPTKSNQALSRILMVDAAPATERTGELGRLLRRTRFRPERGPFEWLLSDLNGETWRTQAWVEDEREAHDALEGAFHDRMIPSLGDCGGATGALLFALAHTFARAGAAPVSACTLALRSDDGLCGVVDFTLPRARLAFQVCIGAPHKHLLTRAMRTSRLTEGEERQCAHVARSCLEDIGSLGVMLAPGPVEESRDPSALAQRLLDNLDALASLGFAVKGAVFDPALAGRVTSYLSEVRPPDRARRFAAGFLSQHLAIGEPAGAKKRPVVASDDE